MNIKELVERLQKHPAENISCFTISEHFENHYFRMTSFGQYNTLLNLYRDLEVRLRFSKKHIGTPFSQKLQRSARQTLQTFERLGDEFVEDKTHLKLQLKHPEYKAKISTIEEKLLVCEQKRDELAYIFEMNYIFQSFDSISFTKARQIYTMGCLIRDEKFEEASKLQKQLRKYFK